MAIIFILPRKKVVVGEIPSISGRVGVLIAQSSVSALVFLSKAVSDERVLSAQF